MAAGVAQRHPMTHGKYMFGNGLSNDARADKADSH
jgi:hypothetical protein